MDKLRQIQLCELDILKELDRVCEENGIPYSLAYGTMLGAVRHKGFIPWDDDLDVYMRYEDTQKIYDLFSTDYFYQTEKTDPQMPFIYYKIRKNNTLMEEECHKHLNIHKGIWIDIFPYINASKTNLGKKLQFQLCKLFQIFRNKYCYAKTRKIVKSRIFVKIIVSLEKICLFLLQKLGSDTSSEYFILTWDPMRMRFYKKNLLDNIQKYQFEDSYFWGIQNYDDYLTQRYGKDYMTPVKYSHISNYDNVIV